MNDSAQQRVNERFVTALTNTRVPDDEDKQVLEVIQNRITSLAHTIEERVPEGRLKSLSLTRLEEVIFWANKAIYAQGATQKDLRTSSERHADEQAERAREGKPPVDMPHLRRFRNKHSGVEVFLKAYTAKNSTKFDAWHVAPVDESGSEYMVTGQELAADYEELS